MNKQLEEFKNLLEKLNSTNSSNEKKEILSSYEGDTKLLWWALNPFKRFYITSNNLKKRKDLILDENSDIPSLTYLLDALSKERVTGYNAIRLVNRFIEDNKEYEDVIYRIIDKDLKVRVDAKLVNKVWPGFIPEFEVALAKDYEDYAHRISFTRDTWYASRKLDGVRIITIVGSEDITFWSRKGKEIFTLDKIADEIDRQNIEPWTVFDGELCIVDENGNEDFSSIMKEIRRKNHTIKNPRYKIFDKLTYGEFISKYSDRLFSNRCRDLINNIEKNSLIDIIPQWRVESKEVLAEMTSKAKENGWEGLILRKDAPYEGKRTNDMLKVKNFYDAEYEIKDLVMAPIRFIEDGKDVEEEMLSSIIIEHKGYKVNVGSGFSIEQRRYYYKNPEELIGTTVTVVYFEETTNKQGTLSLRFPTVKYIHGKNGRKI